MCDTMYWPNYSHLFDNIKWQAHIMELLNMLFLHPTIKPFMHPLFFSVVGYHATTPYSRDAQNPGARSPKQLNFEG